MAFENESGCKQQEGLQHHILTHSIRAAAKPAGPPPIIKTPPEASLDEVVWPEIEHRGKNLRRAA